MDPPNEFPRLTKSMRAFSNLSNPRNINKEAQTLDALRRRKAQEMKRSFTYNEFVNFACKNEIKMTVGVLHSIRSLAGQLSGNDQSKEVVDEATIFLIRLFYGERIVLNRHLMLLRQMFGLVTQNFADNICVEVNKLATLLSEDCLETLEKRWLSSSTASENCNGSAREMYGAKIPYAAPMASANGLKMPDVSFLCDLTTTSTPQLQTLESFSMIYNGQTNSHQSADDKNASSSSSKKHTMDRNWLKRELKKCPGSVGDLCESIVSLLKSSKTSDELQNELFELLGFDSFELIQTLLKHRNDITANIVLEDKKQFVSAAAATVEPKRPTYGCQVVVQSEHEKQLKKLVRKEEKKVNKMAAGREANDSDEEIDIMELRAKRIAELSAPVVNPLLTAKPSAGSSKPAKPKKDDYPHVYDSLSKAKATAGYVSVLC
ncbi:activating signal cointegrator 1 complex subunit 3-like [Nilaparvata lugens]|uniref:activating signal cointegrator 1 complex subunit 3-like n=1 Tax=Nilaparvata lugens TaxID=108931 RepID=UPI00193DCF0A|nr:activating signal cointegrator 1 complex subunit 3-like [Nilaparvata lugens]